MNANLSLFRNFRISERLNLQFRAESDNFSNTPHFSNPNTNVSNARFDANGNVLSLGNFLSITSANTDQRQFRLGLRLDF